MIPYLEPFTMPDGSTRRAIVERVPEIMKAAGLAYPDDDAMFDGTNGEGFIFWRNRKGDAIGHVTEEFASLALCRVACEDWLEDVGILRVLKIKPLDKSKPRGYTADWEAWPAQSFESGFQSTRDAAMVALAHAVADAKGIAP